MPRYAFGCGEWNSRVIFVQKSVVLLRGNDKIVIREEKAMVCYCFSRKSDIQRTPYWNIAHKRERERRVIRITEPYDDEKIRSVADGPTVVVILRCARFDCVIGFRQIERAREAELLHTGKTIVQYLCNQRDVCRIGYTRLWQHVGHWRTNGGGGRAALEKTHWFEDAFLRKNGQKMCKGQRIHFEGAKRYAVLVLVEVLARTETKRALKERVKIIESDILQHFNTRYIEAI